MSIKSNFETIKCSEENGILFLTINRPDKLNALNEIVLAEMKELLTEIDAQRDFPFKGLILTGEGDRAFIAGADIASMSDMTTKEGEKFAILGQDVTFLLENLEMPVIAAVNGFALGGGCEMAMSCDFILATKTAVFGQPEVKLGLIPGFGGTQRLAKLVGRNIAKQLIYTGRNIKADEAYRLGLAIEVLEDKESLLAEAVSTIEKISRNSPLAIAMSKRVMNSGIDLTNKEGLLKERTQFAGLFSSFDMKEGTKAFVEQRKPKFQGK